MFKQVSMEGLGTVLCIWLMFNFPSLLFWSGKQSDRFPENWRGPPVIRIISSWKISLNLLLRIVTPSLEARDSEFCPLFKLLCYFILLASLLAHESLLCQVITLEFLTEESVWCQENLLCFRSLLLGEITVISYNVADSKF